MVVDTNKKTAFYYAVFLFVGLGNILTCFVQYFINFVSFTKCTTVASSTAIIQAGEEEHGEKGRCLNLISSRQIYYLNNSKTFNFNDIDFECSCFSINIVWWSGWSVAPSVWSTIWSPEGGCSGSGQCAFRIEWRVR